MILSGNWKLVGAKSNESTPLSRAIFFIVIGIAFYLLDRFSLFCMDDYMYTYKYGTYEPIRTLKDIIESQRNHYVHFNGRFLVHCVVQLFCGILGIEWFRIFNTLFFVAFCGLTTRLVCGTKSAPIMWYSLIASVIWLFIPRIGYTMLGNIACCVNYLWAGTANILFLLIYNKLRKQQGLQSFWVSVGCGIVGVILGSLQESFSVPIAGALFIYYCFNYKQFHGAIAWLIMGYWLGAMILVLAPGNFVRLDAVSVNAGNWLINKIANVFRIMRDSYLLLFAILIHLVLFFINKTRIVDFIRKYRYNYLAIIISITFSIYVYMGEHQLFFLGILLITLIMRFSFEYKRIEDYLKVIVAIVSIITICSYIISYRNMLKIYQIRERMVQNIINSQDGKVVVGDWAAAMCTKGIIASRYTIEHELASWPNYVSLYYTGDVSSGSNYIPCSVDELILLLDENYQVSKNVWFLPQYFCYVIKMHNNESIDDIEIEEDVKNLYTKGCRTQSVSKYLILGDLNYGNDRFYFYFLTSHNKDRVVNVRYKIK